MQKNFKDKLTDLNADVTQLWKDACHDKRTGIYNLTALQDELAKCAGKLREDNSRSFAVLFMDLNGFKQVNDSMGHDAGDLLLIEVANRLTAQHKDNAFRYGGDEFVVIVPSCDSSESAMTIAEETRKNLAKEYCIYDQSASVGPSIGVVFCDSNYPLIGDDSDASRGILRAADDTMYLAKRMSKESLLVEKQPHRGKCLLHGPEMPVIFEYPEYSAPLRSGFGKGRMIFSDATWDAAFRFVQYSDGQIRLFSRHSSPIPDKKSSKELSNGNGKFEFLAQAPEDNFKCLVTTKSKMFAFLLSQVTEMKGEVRTAIGDDIFYHLLAADLLFEHGLPHSMRFYLTNCDFPSYRAFSSQLVFKLNSFNLTLKPIDDVENIIKELKATKGIKVTAYADIEISSAGQIEEVVNLLNEFCVALTLVQASRVNWISYDVLSEKSEVLSGYCWHADSGAMHAEHFETSGSANSLVSEILKHLPEARKSWNMDYVLDFFCKAFNTEDTAEGQAYKIVHCIDLLASAYRRNFQTDESHSSDKDHQVTLIEMCDHLGIDCVLNSGEAREAALRRITKEIVDLRYALQNYGTLALLQQAPVDEAKREAFHEERGRRLLFLQEFLRSCLMSILNPGHPYLICGSYPEEYEVAPTGADSAPYTEPEKSS